MRHGPDKLVGCGECGRPWGVIRPSSREVGEALLRAAVAKFAVEVEAVVLHLPPIAEELVRYAPPSFPAFSEQVFFDSPLDGATYYLDSEWRDLYPPWILPPALPALRWDCCSIKMEYSE